MDFNTPEEDEANAEILREMREFLVEMLSGLLDVVFWVVVLCLGVSAAAQVGVLVMSI